LHESAEFQRHLFGNCRSATRFGNCAFNNAELGHLNFEAVTRLGEQG
jgi:hypothetical protein